MSTPVVVVLLTLLLGIQPLTTDLYLPALPTIAADLDAGMGPAQLTLSILIISFGLAQLVFGPLADRFGRRPVLLGGMALYTAASVASALAPTIEWLVGWRALQGAAMASAVTCGRSIVRDLYEPHEGARAMSRAMGGLGVIAMLSPLVGGTLVQWVNWKAALLVPALFGAGALGFIAWRFQETVPARNVAATRLGPMLRNWSVLLHHPGFRAWASLLAMTYGGLFVFLAASSFVFIEVLGVSRVGYGAIMTSNSFAYTAGTVVCRQLLATRGLTRTVKLAAAFTLAGGLASALLSLSGVHTVWAVLVPQWIFSFGHGIHQPCGQAGAVGPFPEKAGTAAALSGFIMMATAFLIGLWLGRALNGTVYPLTLGIGACSIGVATVAWTLVQRHGEPAPAPQAA